MSNHSEGTTSGNRRGTGRRGFLAAAGAGTAISLAGCLTDDGNGGGGGGDGDDGDWEPSQRIRYIIPYDEGGGTDVYARGIVEGLTEAMGQDIQIDNIPGGGGLNGFGEAIRSDSDGHTVAGSAVPLEVTPQMLDDPGFDQRDLRGVGVIGRSTWCLVVNSEYEGEVETFDDVIEKHNSGEWDSIGIQEPGSPQDIITLLARHEEETYAPEYDWNWENRAQYTGTGPVTQAVASGEVPCGIGTDAGTEPNVSAGEVYPVVTFFSEGTDVYPDLPSVTDEGYPEMDFISGVTRGIYVPPDTSDQRIEVLADRFEEAVNHESTVEWSEETGNPSFFEGPETAEQAMADPFDVIEELEILDLIDTYSE